MPAEEPRCCPLKKSKRAMTNYIQNDIMKDPILWQMVLHLVKGITSITVVPSILTAAEKPHNMGAVPADFIEEQAKVHIWQDTMKQITSQCPARVHHDDGMLFQYRPDQSSMSQAMSPSLSGC